MNKQLLMKTPVILFVNIGLPDGDKLHDTIVGAGRTCIRVNKDDGSPHEAVDGKCGRIIGYDEILGMFAKPQASC